MEKRVILAVVLCVAVLMVWSKLFPVKPPAPPPPRTAAAGAGWRRRRRPSGAARLRPPAAAAPTRSSWSTIETPDVQFVFIEPGGAPGPRPARAEVPATGQNDPTSGHDLVATPDPREAPFGRPSPIRGLRAGRRRVGGAPARRQQLVFAADSGPRHIEKRYVVDTNRYRCTCTCR